MSKKQLFHVAAFLAAALLLLAVCSRVLIHKASEEAIGWLLREDSEPEVLFFGPSHMLNAVDAGVLWTEYGIAAYNCSIPGQQMGVTFLEVQAFLDAKKPKVIVVDTHTLSWISGEGGLTDLHKALDSLPLGPAKLSLAQAGASGDGWLELAFPFSVYHARWSELTREDFVPVSQAFRSHLSGSVATYFSVDELAPASFREPVTGTAYKALEDIALLCQEKGVQLVLMKTPGPNSSFQQRYINQAYTLAEAYHLPYLDFQRLDAVDPDSDFEDLAYSAATDEMNYHLNASGAIKVSRVIGDFLQSEYGLGGHQGEPGYALWDEKEQTYLDQRAEAMLGEATLYELLVLAANPTISTCVLLPSGTAVAEDPTALAVLANLGLSPAPERLAEHTYLGFAGPDGVQEAWDAGEVAACFPASGATRSFAFAEEAGGVYRNPGLLLDGADYSLRSYDAGVRQPLRADLQAFFFDNRSGSLLRTESYLLDSRLDLYLRMESAVGGVSPAA